MNSKVKHFLFRMLCGFFLGISVIAPGISGSVMAVMMGIYHDLISIISNPFKNFKHNFFYLLPMGIGGALGAVFSLFAIDYIFDNWPTAGYLLFVGLIGGSLPTVFKEGKKSGFKMHYIIGILFAFALAATIALSANKEVIGTVGIDVIYCTVCGFIAGAASMVPGMSISMILIVLGVYNNLRETALSMDIMHLTTLIPVGIAFVIGMVSFSKLTKYIFEKFPGLGYFMVFGFMCGSLIGIFPREMPQDTMTWILSPLLLILGVGISFMFVKLGEKFNVDDAQEESNAVHA